VHMARMVGGEGKQVWVALELVKEAKFKIC
jgi:hypothetical protein